MTWRHDRGPAHADGGQVDPEGPGLLEDDVDCCEVCAIPSVAHAR